MNWDLTIMEAVADHRVGWITALARGLMAAGQPIGTYLAAAVLALVIAWRYRAWLPVVCALLSSAVATGVAGAAKELIGRPRPPADLAVVAAGGLAMPSSIGALTAGAATPLVLAGLRSATRAGRSAAAALISGTVAVGLCMVYLGAHWLSDVLVGWALGAAIGAALFHLFRLADDRLRRARDERPRDWNDRRQTSTTRSPSSSRTR
jgi:membrane-associated phospholipid phosphatase